MKSCLSGKAGKRALIGLFEFPPLGRSFICNAKSQYAVSIYLSGGEGVLYLPHGNPDGSGVNLCRLTGEESK